ncbi:unnamed protein product, partial [Iphiclides podalirius]
MHSLADAHSRILHFYGGKSKAERGTGGEEGGGGGERGATAARRTLKRRPCDYSVYRTESMLRSRQALFVTSSHLVCTAPLNELYANNALS